MLSIDELFAARVNELARKHASPRPTDVLDSARLVRQLLVDGEPLAHAANREHRLKLRFSFVLRPPPPDGVAPVIAWASLLSPAEAISEHSLDSFLGTDVVWVQGERVTVREFVKYLANRAGGVHHARDLDERETEIAGILGSLLVGNGSAFAQVMREVAVVVLDAVTPLYGEIVKDPIDLGAAKPPVGQYYFSFPPVRTAPVRRRDDTSIAWLGELRLQQPVPPDLQTLCALRDSTRRYPALDVQYHDGELVGAYRYNSSGRLVVRVDLRGLEHRSEFQTYGFFFAWDGEELRSHALIGAQVIAGPTVTARVVYTTFDHQVTGAAPGGRHRARIDLSGFAIRGGVDEAELREIARSVYLRSL